MDTDTIIRQLEYKADKHKNDRLLTGQTDITTLCRDLIPKMKELKRYEDLEQGGRLLELPCKVGSTIFVDLNTLPFTDMEYSEEEQSEIPKFLPARVVSYRKNARTTFMKIAVSANWLYEWIDPETGPDSAYYEKERYFSYPISAIGKTLFLSEEAAEAALKEMEG